MSERNENEKAHHKKVEDKKSGLKLKNERNVTNNGNSVSEESGKFEECSGKNPKLKNDLKELFDNFGQDTDSQVNISPQCSLETNEAVKKDITSESYSEQCIENLVSTDEFSRVNNKNSFETTLDGKCIAVNDGSCNCHELKCTCSQTDHNITDIEESQTNYKRNEIPPYDAYSVLPSKHPYVIKECCDHEDPHVNRTNRYNYNQVHIRHHQKEKKRCHKLFPRRYKTNKSHVSTNDSGETIPQLYKANVKHLRNYGFVPEKFTFRAVTGNLPGHLEYHHSCIDPAYHPYFPTRRVNFMDDNLIQNPEQRKSKKQRKCIFKQVNRNKSRELEKNKLKYSANGATVYKIKKTYDIHNKNDFFDQNNYPTDHKIKKNYDIHNNQNDFFDHACLPFDGNEYISNKQLPDRIDIYCFDHLNTSYFRTCDQPPPLITDIAMEKTEEVATRFWAEIFGFIHVIIAFFIAFILQLYKFLLYSIVRPIMVGLVQLTSDYFFKPLLTIIYNGFTQPFLVFLFNLAASLRDLCLPIAKGLGYFISEIAVLLRAIRLADCGKNPSYRMKDSCC